MVPNGRTPSPHTRRVPRELEFFPANYYWCLRRELELHTQHLEESLLQYVRAMDEPYRLANPLATDTEKVERVTRCLRPTSVDVGSET